MRDMASAVRAEVEAIVPHDEIERAHRADTLAWIASGAPLCRTAKPATPPRHQVSYFVVTDGTGLLLVDHRNAGLWLPTGGHVEPEEHPRETVTRELVEELGFAPPHPIGPPLMITQSTTIGLTAGHVDVSLWYVVTAPRSQALQWDIHEFVDARWFDFADIPITRSDPHIRRFVTKLRAS